jgi:hypothetical protein
MNNVYISKMFDKLYSHAVLTMTAEPLAQDQ